MPIFEEEYRGEEQRTVAPEERVEEGDAGIAVFRGKRLPWAPGMYELRYHHDGKHNVMSIISPIEIYVDKPDPVQMHSYRAVHDTVMNIVCFALEGQASLVPRSARKMAKSTRRQLSIHAPDAPLHVREGSTASQVSTTSSLSSRPAPLAISELASEMAHGSVSSDSVPGSPPPEALTDSPLQDPDDFVLMDEHQVKHIQQMLEWTYGVELSPDVVIADANVGALSKRILGARNLLDGTTPPTPAATAAPTGTATPVTGEALTASTSAPA